MFNRTLKLDLVKTPKEVATEEVHDPVETAVLVTATADTIAKNLFMVVAAYKVVDTMLKIVENKLTN